MKYANAVIGFRLFLFKLHSYGFVQDSARDFDPSLLSGSSANCRDAEVKAHKLPLKN